jgi:pimeloyl-ACP methyl ester carboxylesterase
MPPSSLTIIIYGVARARLGAKIRKGLYVARMDRRGRGGSGDSTEYAIEREFEDVATVVNALDAPILLFGHSFGAVCALEAAMRTDKLAGLVLYEAPVCEGGCCRDLCWNWVTRSPAFREYRVRPRGQLADRWMFWQASANRQPFAC